MANGGTIFEKALQVSTPGFNALLDVIQTETKRIERNRALAEQRKQKIELARLESGLSLSRQKIAQQERQKDAIERIKLDHKLALKRQEEKQQDILERTEAEENRQTTEDLFDNFKEAREDAQQRQDKLYQKYGKVYQQGILPEPIVTPKRHESGFFVNVVTNKDGEVVKTSDEFWQDSSDFMILANFMEDLQNPASLSETKNAENIQRKGTTFITRSNASQVLKEIRNMSIEEKRQFNELLLNGEFDVANKGMFSDAPEVKVEEDEASGVGISMDSMEDVRGLYLDIKGNGGTLILPPDYTGTDKPASINLFDSSVNQIQDESNKLFEYAKEEGILEKAEDGTGDWIPYTDLDEMSEGEKRVIEGLKTTEGFLKLFERYKNSTADIKSTNPNDWYVNPDWDGNLNKETDLEKVWSFREQYRTKGDSERESVNRDQEIVRDLTSGINLEDIE